MIGVLTDKIQFNQKSIFLVKNFNQLNKTNNCCIFCNEMHNRPVDVHFNIMPQIKSYCFQGTLITDSLLLTQVLHYNIYTKKKYYYVWNLDWIHLDNLFFGQLKIPFYNNEIELIARSQSHADLLEKLFKKPKYIMEDWDWKVLQRIDEDE
jgi:hypothetical protein